MAHSFGRTRVTIPFLPYHINVAVRQHSFTPAGDKLHLIFDIVYLHLFVFILDQ
jgi:hypothetical protein